MGGIGTPAYSGHEQGASDPTRTDPRESRPPSPPSVQGPGPMVGHHQRGGFRPQAASYDAFAAAPMGLHKTVNDPFSALNHVSN